MIRNIKAHMHLLAIGGLLIAGPLYAQDPMDMGTAEMPPPEQPQEAPKEVDLRQGTPPVSYKSTMLYEEEKKQISQVIQAIKQKEPLPTENADQTREEAAPPPMLTSYIFPQFYLTSIVFQGPEDWIIWINHQKITSQKRNVIPGLTIDKVTRYEVNMTYDFTGDTNINVQSQSADPRIDIRPNEQRASFTLEPNQTFSTYSWQIFEGYIEPARLALKPTRQQAAPSLNVPGLEEIIDTDEQQGPVQKQEKLPGIGGIMQQYKTIDERL